MDEHTIEKIADGFYRVTNNKDLITYYVDTKANLCSCKSFKYCKKKIKSCKHLKLCKGLKDGK